MPTIALYGGSFDPPHLAHALVCLYVLETAPVDALWMVPTYRHVFEKDLAPFSDRVRMCERVAQGFGGRVGVSEVEAELDAGESRMLETIFELQRRHPETRFRLVIGADILQDTHRWYRWHEVERAAPPIVVGRSGYSHHAVAGLEMPALSSSDVRKRLRAGQRVEGLVSRAVIEYIGQAGLYR